MSSLKLLDDDGAVTEQFERVLQRIFLKYCTPKPSETNPSTLPTNAYLPPDALDKWATDTNGSTLPDDQKEEIKEYMDVNEEGNLTFKGFVQIYQLQTENDEEETWKDLQKHGFTRNLEANISSTN